jgi:LytS/YehU family sensor histidine kinase
MAVAVKDSELRALLAQLNPHFIFNCLNSLRALIVEDPPRAQTMVDQLSSILRYSLKSGSVETVPLRDEIEAISAYLKLELIRFEDRLQVSMDIDPATLAAEIPPMLLQTLVENGVKHGISRLAQGGEIRVVSRVEPAGLRLQVINSGQLTPAGNTTHIGIDNARERLRILYGAAASLALKNLDSKSVLAEVSVPFARGEA